MIVLILGQVFKDQLKAPERLLISIDLTVEQHVSCQLCTASFGPTGPCSWAWSASTALKISAPSASWCSGGLGLPGEPSGSPPAWLPRSPGRRRQDHRPTGHLGRWPSPTQSLLAAAVLGALLVGQNAEHPLGHAEFARKRLVHVPRAIGC